MLKRSLGIAILLVVACCSSAFAQEIKFNGFSGTSRSYFNEFVNGFFHAEFDVDGDPNGLEDVQYQWYLASYRSYNFYDGVTLNVNFDNRTKASPHITIDLVGLCMQHTHADLYALIAVVRYSKYGTQAEILTVHFTNHIIVNFGLNPNRQCWADGDEIKKDDFIFKTDPPGYEADVDIDEDSRIASASMGGESHEKVYFTFRGQKITNEYATVTVIENSWQYDILGGKIDRKILMAMDAIEKSGKMADKCKSVTDKVQKCKLLKKIGVEFDINPYFSLNLGVKKDCCAGQPVCFFNVNCHIGTEFSLGAHIPCPSFPPLHLDIGVQGAIDMTLFDAMVTANVNGENCDYITFVPMSLDLGLYVGASLDPLEGLATIGVKGIGGAQWNMWYYATTNGWKFASPNLYFKIDVEANYLIGHSHWQWNLLD